MSNGYFYGGCAVVALAAVYISTTRVLPNQVAYFRTMGSYVDCGPLVKVMVDNKEETSHAYYGPGLHFNWPFIQSADKMQVSQRLTDPHTTKATLGQQNQPAEFDYQVMVNVPAHGTHLPNGQYIDSVYHLLYEVGQVGSSDVDATVDRYIDAGLNKALAPIEPDELSTKRETILTTVTGGVRKDLAELGVLLDSDIKITRSELQGAWKE